MKKLLIIFLLFFYNNCNAISNKDLFIIALIDKYGCPTTPIQLSVFNQAVKLTGTTPVNTTTIKKSNDIGKLILKYTNQYRARKGVGPLTWDQFLAEVARPHTVAMARGTAPFNHSGFENRFNKYRSKRPNAISFGENLLYVLNPNLLTNDQLARYAVNSWIKSPGHEANLRGQYNRMGAAVFKNVNNVWYMTQLFSLLR